jgi:molecular chaperone DnaK
MVKEIFGKEPNQSVNPDEVVSLGAAIQGACARRRGQRRAAARRHAAVARHRDAGRGDDQADRAQHDDPDQAQQVFSTAADNQPGVDIHVLQGEREFANDNRTLGRFKLDGIPPARAARRRSRSRSTSTPTASCRSAPPPRTRAPARSRRSARPRSKRRREEIALFNKADSLVYETEKMINELGDKLDSAEKAKIIDAVADLKKALEDKNADLVKERVASLEQATHALSQKLYSQAGGPGAEAGAGAGAAGAGAQAGAAGNNADDVVDAEFEVKDDNK